jgi:hypothetical protein
VVRLGEELDVPFTGTQPTAARRRTTAAHPRSTIDSANLSTFWAALETLLAAHLRYPAMVLHGHWTVPLANPSCARLYGGDLVGVNLVRRFAEPAAQQTIVNWPEVAWAGLARLRHQLDRTPFDDPGRPASVQGFLATTAFGSSTTSARSAC